MARPASRFASRFASCFAAWMRGALVCAGAVSCTGRIGDRPEAEAHTTDPGGGNAGGAGGGNVGGSDAGGGASARADGWPSFRASKAFQLRRLTNEQYTASVKTLLGVSTDGMPPIEQVSPAGGFSAIGASSASVSGSGVAEFEGAARFLARAVFASGRPSSKVVPCTPSGVDDTACFQSFVTSFGEKAFRRPLTPEEVDRYTTLTRDIAASTGDPSQALEATLSAFLQSPNFLYLAEVGAPDPGNSTRYQYSADEMASRLAYFLTNDTPDEALRASALSGELLTTDGVAAQVSRLLQTPAARDSVRSFFRGLLSLDNLDGLTRPVEVFPRFSPGIGAAMKEETLLGIDDLVFDSDGDYRTLFDRRETFVNAQLAALYGVPAPAGSGFTRVTLPESTGRIGLLGQAGVLAARDHSDGTSPTKRGLFVLTRLLCQNLALMPPANLEIPPLPTGKLTARQRLEEHAKNAVCASCHGTMDPVGLSLEHFDAMGAYRDTDHGLSIDDTGVIDGQSYAGLAGLGEVLRDHPALGPCLIQSVYDVAVGHLATDFDRDTFASVAEEFESGGGHVRSLLVAIAKSDGFRYLPVPGGN